MYIINLKMRLTVVIAQRKYTANLNESLHPPTSTPRANKMTTAGIYQLKGSVENIKYDGIASVSVM